MGVIIFLYLYSLTFFVLSGGRFQTRVDGRLHQLSYRIISLKFRYQRFSFTTIGQVTHFFFSFVNSPLTKESCSLLGFIFLYSSLYDNTKKRGTYRTFRSHVIF